MNVYILEPRDLNILGKLMNYPFTLRKYSDDQYEENSVFVVDGNDTEYVFSQLVEKTKLIKNKSLVFLHHFKSLSYNSEFGLVRFNNIFTDSAFDPARIYIITQLEYDVPFIQKYIPGATVIIFDKWLNELFERQIENILFLDNVYTEYSDLVFKRFSVFIRRYELIRFEFLCELIAADILPDLYYTFVNHHPVDLDTMRESIPLHLADSNDKIQEWISGIPYQVYRTKPIEWDDYPFDLKNYYDNSGIHICFETEPKQGSSFITEKTYRAMYFKKPMIWVSAHHSLKALRAGGYKTFSPFIDESYDDIADYDQRVVAILTEIKRLHALPIDEFTQLVSNCKEIVEYNFYKLYENKFKPLPDYCNLKHFLTF